jgi:fatty-acyl-CoA synthase
MIVRKESAGSQLLIRTIAERAETLFGSTEVVTLLNGSSTVTDYSSVVRRARMLASALLKHGVGPGDCIATLLPNVQEHLELYFAVPGIGAVLHTLNPRMDDDALHYIVDQAGDQMAFYSGDEGSDTPACLSRIGRRVRVGPGGGVDDFSSYEEFLEEGTPDYEFPEFDERTASTLCYTSGTTGRPRGVVYSHRSTVLHTLMQNQPDAYGIRESDTVFPIVPMYHGNAWGLPYAAAMAGARLVLPGRLTEPLGLGEAINRHTVTFAAGVPAVWIRMMDCKAMPKLETLREVIVGGSAVPESLIRWFDELHETTLIQGWGMTEGNPLTGVSRLPARPPKTIQEQYALRCTQGRPVPLVNVRLSPDGDGELQLAGPTIVGGYHLLETDRGTVTEDGWLRTGDIARILDGSYIQLVDRTKDLVKSGGEWISSIELENVLQGHDSVAEVAVVARPDERWGERPYALVVLKSGAEASPNDLRAFLSNRIPRWWIPDQIEVVSSLPRTAVGKIDKRAIRAEILASSDRGGSKS